MPKLDKSWARQDSDASGGQADGRPRKRREIAERDNSKGKGKGKSSFATQEHHPPRKDTPPDKGLERFRIEVGHNDNVMPGNIVGAIANEAGLDSKDIGRINIYDGYSTVDLPADMPDDIFKDLKNVWVASKKLNISRNSESPESPQRNSKERSAPTNFSAPGAGDRPIRRKPKIRADGKPGNPARAKPKKSAKNRVKDKKAIGKRR
jgi:hypothetical protein